MVLHTGVETWTRNSEFAGSIPKWDTASAPLSRCTAKYLIVTAPVKYLAV